MIINNYLEYEQAKRATEVSPLITGYDDGESIVVIPIRVRVDIQKILFYSKTRAGQMQKFYRWCWKHLQQRCEETNTPLQFYSSVFISHIQSRGAHPEKSIDPRNINILIPDAHRQWENGDKESMRIYWRNQRTIIRLNKEYWKLRPKNLK